MRKSNFFSILPLLLGAAAFTVPASAELITADNVIVLQTANGQSFYNNFHASDGTSGNTWVTTAPNGGNGNDYFDKNRVQPNPILLFDLSSNQTLDSLALWNYGGGNALKSFTLSFYDSANFSGTPAATQQVTLSSATGNNVKLDIPLDAPVTARWVKMELTDNFFGSGVGGGDRVGIGELQFNRTNTVTEIKPTSVSQISGTALGDHPAGNLIDGSASAGWCSAQAASDYYNGSNPIPKLEFTFDGTQNVSSITVTPYHISAGNSGKDFNLTFYDADGNKIAVEDESKYSFKMLRYDSTDPQLFTFPEVQGAAKVVMEITDNFKHLGKGNYAGGDRVGLTEVTFGNHQYTEGPTFQTSYNTPQKGLDVIRPDSVSINNTSLSGTNINNLLGGRGYSRSGQWYTIDRKDSNNKVYGDYFAVPDEKYVNPILTFASDEDILAEGFLIWGYGSGVSGNGLTEFAMEFYDDDMLVFADTFIVDRAFGQDEYANFMFDEAFAFDEVSMTLLDNSYKWFNSGGGGDRIGFNGLAFYQDANKVPEPSAWALMLLGTAGLVTLRTRKHKTTQA
ncbi:MAG: PEP-CTERM sorting domain-containing protein [Thermoguttaceae bacterium]|nr:PEP-CTERM sorting domain-containing protein [Thermoguttaceae bacterium]